MLQSTLVSFNSCLNFNKLGYTLSWTIKSRFWFIYYWKKWNAKVQKKMKNLDFSCTFWVTEKWKIYFAACCKFSNKNIDCLNFFKISSLNLQHVKMQLSLHKLFEPLADLLINNGFESENTKNSHFLWKKLRKQKMKNQKKLFD